MRSTFPTTLPLGAATIRPGPKQRTVRRVGISVAAMTIVADGLSILLALEFLFAPFNLWTGRTLPNFVRFTGFPPTVARRVFAPFKLLLAVALIVGLFVRAVSIAGALGTIAISGAYLVRLLTRHRVEIDGFLAFGITMLAGVAIALIQFSS
jgi:hypothetical protein